MKYDVEIPGRPFPWTQVGTLGPAYFERGETVTIGFLDRSGQIPIILTQKPWSSNLPDWKTPFELDSEWTAYLANGARQSVSSHLPVDLRTLRAMEALYITSDDLVRVWGNEIVADIFGGFLAFMEFGEQYLAFEYPVFFAASAPLRDIRLDLEAGTLYLLTSTAIQKVDRASLSQAWLRPLGSGPVSGGGTAAYVPIAKTLCLSRRGDEEDLAEVVSVLSTKAHETLGKPSLHLHSYLRSDGTPAAGAVRLSYPQEPPFWPEETYPVVSRFTTGTAVWPWYWDPAALGSNPVQGGKHKMAIKPAWLTSGANVQVPWARIGDRIDNQWSPPIFPESPAGPINTNGHIHLGTQDPVSGGDPPEVMTYPANVAMTISKGKVMIPRYNIPTSCLSAFDLETGQRLWDHPGWTVPFADGQHTREFFTPLLVRTEEILVVTRRAKFLDVDIDYKTFAGESYLVPLPGQGLFPDAFDEWWRNTGVITDENLHPNCVSRRCRICVSVEDSLEVFSLLDGTRLASTLLSPLKITSMGHRPEAFVGEDPGPHKTYDYASQAGVPHPFAGRPTRPEASNNYYSMAVLAPRAQLEVSVGTISGTAVDNAVDQASAWLVDKDGFIYRNGSPGTTYENKFVARRFDTSADAPLLFDKLNPVLSSDGEIVIFPPRTYSAAMYDGDSRMVLAGAKRDWDPHGIIDAETGVSWSGGSVSNGWLSDVTMGPDWNKGTLWFFGFNVSGGEAWRHKFQYNPAQSISWARPCCGDGKLQWAYKLAGVSRLRLIDERTGELIDDYALTVMSGLSPGTPKHLMLCQQASVLVTDSAVFSILPDS
jgi:hypothetical protein